MTMNAQLTRLFAILTLFAIMTLALAGGAGAVPDERYDEGDQLYQRGHYEKAMEWWKVAADKGSTNAQYRLGATYNDGVARDKDVIVVPNFKEAAKWLTLAAESGDERAQFDLGTLYDNGLGVAESKAEAARWFLAGAERGQVACQYNIAVMYEDGVGVPKDSVAAYKWYYLAAQQGFIEFGGPALEKLSRKMQPDQVRNAIKLAKEMKAIPVVR